MQKIIVCDMPPAAAGAGGGPGNPRNGLPGRRGRGGPYAARRYLGRRGRRGRRLNPRRRCPYMSTFSSLIVETLSYEPKDTGLNLSCIGTHTHTQSTYI